MDSDSIVLSWDEEEVNEWLTTIGFHQYRENIFDHGISGDVLIHLDFEALRDIGIASAGHRLEILKAVYRLKVENGIPIEADHYVPLSETNEDVFAEHTPVGRLMQMIGSQNEKIRLLEQEIQRLQTGIVSLEEYVFKGSGGASLQKQPSIKWASYGRTVKSPTKPMPDDTTGANLQQHDSPRASPQALEHDLSHQASSTLRPPPKTQEPMEINMSSHSLPGRTPSQPNFTSIPDPPAQTTERTQAPVRQQSNGAAAEASQSRSRTNDDRSDNVFQSFKVSLEDPCSKVLPAALKKYRITDDWRLYALFICYGTTERCLSLDEKPLLLFKKLKDAGKNPVFMLRHVRDIRAPITVAQGKQAEKKTRDGQGSMDASQPTNGTHRELRLHQAVPALTNRRSNGHMNHSYEGDRPRTAEDPNGDYGTRTNGNGAGHNDVAILWTGISYAIAIYPYGADYDDEFDVRVGATFIVLRRSKGWWQVQRDPSGSGVIDDRARKAWVPAGCLLETNVPPSAAISDAAIGASTQPTSPGSMERSLASPLAHQPTSDAPILPTSIVSTSYPGIALMDWLPQGDHELDLVKDDTLRVFKRYNHWSYVVKESGKRGWVPSWLIGKMQSVSHANPVTPATAGTNYDGNGDEGQTSSRTLGTELNQSSLSLNAPLGTQGFAPQPSPMSPAFSAMTR